MPTLEHLQNIVSLFIIVTRLWENKNVMGDLEKATSRDYKNQGYYSIQASILIVG